MSESMELTQKKINRNSFPYGHVFSLKSSISFCLGNENRRNLLGPFLDRDSDDDNDNDDDSDDSDENLEEWLNNSGKMALFPRGCPMN